MGSSDPLAHHDTPRLYPHTLTFCTDTQGGKLLPF